MQRGKKKILWIVLALVGGCLLFVTSLFFIRLDVHPPDDTRVILEHTHETYIVPPCFEQAQTTNNLSEATWTDVAETGYEAESSCTSDHLQPENKSLLRVISEGLQIEESSWDW